MKNSIRKNEHKLRMSYSEFFELAKRQPWKIGKCSQGEICWCRTILTDTMVFDEEGQLLNVVDSGAIHKELAEYIVNLHNANLK